MIALVNQSVLLFEAKKFKEFNETQNFLSTKNRKV